MQIVDVSVEFASGATISDRGTLLTGNSFVQVSGQLVKALRLMSDAGPPPKVTARINGRTMLLEPGGDGLFRIGSESVIAGQSTSFWWKLVTLVNSPSREQRQQFARFMHTLSAASLIGAIGLWHSTSNWSAVNVLNEVDLCLAFVITFYAGMVSMNGE
ncbi:hypothetical protein [Paraburkholderia rhizosphaerae]|uniref:Uncharacterized protein n=1 Tax=Paraburkholderia rhizosphaerae TaxID=480658 RepID=A0A4R8LRW9_9BURK|nr:hypothetical protein [Paraburkholderia rhizosphaerae]TDY48313.1 hypothetical protein BX592_111248 [Paraburkholderia rhizosphaerae]